MANVAEYSSKVIPIRTSAVWSIIIGASMVVALFVMSLYSTLLLNTVVEYVVISISLCAFLITWNSKDHIKNGYLLFIGVAYLFVGSFDLLHSIAYQGMGIFNRQDSNLQTQLWISARYIESCSLLAATFFFTHRPNLTFEIISYCLLSVAVLISIFYLNIFPGCYVDGPGLTQFKVASEYVICLILLATLILLIRNRKRFESYVLWLLVGAIVAKILTEIVLTLYVSAYNLSNLMGNYLKILSFYLIYEALIETGFRQPYELLFRELDLERDKLQKETSQREHFEQALTKSEERYRVVADFAYDWEYWIDPEGKFVYVSPSCERVTGYSAAEFMADAKLFLEIVFDDDKTVVKKHLDSTLTSDESTPCTFDFRVRHKNGEIRWINHSCQPVTSSDGAYLGRRASNRDITEAKRAIELIRQADRHRAVADLAGGIAHNFNNLLQIVISGIENSISDMDEGDLKKAQNSLELILDSCDKGADTVRKLLHFASARSDDQNMSHKILDLAELVKEAIEVSRPFWEDQADREGVKIDMKLDFKPGIFVRGQFNQLIDVVISLIRNAVEALRNQGVIEISVDNEGNEGIVTVTDSGIGISHGDLDRLFTPFFTTKVTAGSGLALATGRTIVDNHGGKIIVESVLGQGTTFKVRLPLSREKPVSESDDVSPGISRGRRILVVDDAKVVTDMLGAVLTKESYAVTTATSGAESIEKFRKEPIDAIVCDLGMPDMNGLELSRRIKAISEYRGVPKPPFIIITGWDQKLSPEFIKAGVDDILIKPVKVGMLLASLDKGFKDRSTAITS